VYDDRIEPDPVEEGEREGKFVDLVENGAPNLDDCEFGGLGGMGGSRKNAEISLDFPFGADRIEQPCNRFLVVRSSTSGGAGDESDEILTLSVCAFVVVSSLMDGRVTGTLVDARPTLARRASRRTASMVARGRGGSRLLGREEDNVIENRRERKGFFYKELKEFYRKVGGQAVILGVSGYFGRAMSEIEPWNRPCKSASSIHPWSIYCRALV